MAKCRLCPTGGVKGFSITAVYLNLVASQVASSCRLHVAVMFDVQSANSIGRPDTNPRARMAYGVTSDNPAARIVLPKPKDRTGGFGKARSTIFGKPFSHKASPN